MFEDEEFDWDLEGDILLSRQVEDERTSSVTEAATSKQASQDEPHPDPNNEEDIFVASLLEQSRTSEESQPRNRAPSSEEPVFKMPRLDPPAVVQTKAVPPRSKAKFPGPAGVISASNKTSGMLNKDGLQSSSQSTQSQQVQHTTVELTDRNLAWQHFLRSEEIASDENSASMLDLYNVSWAKTKMVQSGRTFKMPILVGAIRSLDLSMGLDPRCELVDKTGSMSCLIHRDLFERHGTSLTLPGTVLFLKNVTVMKQSNGAPSAIVTPNNLVSVYFTKDTIVSVETGNHPRMTKDDVRRNAARLVRDEAAQRRVLATVNAQPLQNTALNSTTNQTSSQFFPGIASTPMLVRGLITGTPSSIARPSLNIPPPPRATPLSTSLGRSPPSSVGSLQRLPGPSSSSGSSLPHVPGPSSVTILPANLPGTHGSSSSLLTPQVSVTRILSPGSSLSKLPSVQASGGGLPQLHSAHSPSSVSARLSSPSLSNSSLSGLSSLHQFRAPAPSPPTSNQTLSMVSNVSTNSNRTPTTSNIETTGGNVADESNLQTSQKVVPRFKFQAPIKKQISDDSMFYESQKSADVSTQKSPSGEVEDLLEGLDEDSIFGDF